MVYNTSKVIEPILYNESPTSDSDYVPKVINIQISEDLNEDASENDQLLPVIDPHIGRQLCQIIKNRK